MKQSSFAAVLAILGSLWMSLVILKGWYSLAIMTNYFGMLATHVVGYKGIAPSAMTVWMFNLWLVLTSAIEWAAIGLLIRRALRVRS